MSAVLAAQQHDVLKINPLDSPVVVIDDFFVRPDEVRALALQEDYGDDKIYPGRRAPKRVIEGDLVKAFERYVSKPILKLESTFQIQPDRFEQESFIHGDLCDWAGVVYLNQDRDGLPGTSFFRHKATGMNKLMLGVDLMFKAIEKGVQPSAISGPPSEDRFDFSKWDTVLTVPIRYNRLVLYNAKLFHRNASAWGNDITDARLVQGFFIFTEPFDQQAAGLDVLAPGPRPV